MAAIQADMNTRLHVMNQPKLAEGSEQPENMMLHLVKLGRWGEEIGSEEYITGTLPMAPDAGKQALGRRFVLMSFESEGFRGLIASTPGMDSGPAICAWLRTNLLDGRDTQEVLRTLLTNLTLDINSTPLVTFLADFQLITSEIQPAMPARQLCLHQVMVASRPASQGWESRQGFR